MKLWLVSTASFHTFLVRANTAEQARQVAMDGPAIDECCTGEVLGYKESGVDPATWDVEAVDPSGDVGVLEFF